MVYVLCVQSKGVSQTKLSSIRCGSVHLGGGRGEGGGEGSGNRSILDCSNMMTVFVRVMRETSVCC